MGRESKYTTNHSNHSSTLQKHAGLKPTGRPGIWKTGTELGRRSERLKRRKKRDGQEHGKHEWERPVAGVAPLLLRYFGLPAHPFRLSPAVDPTQILKGVEDPSAPCLRFGYYTCRSRFSSFILSFQRPPPPPLPWRNKGHSRGAAHSRRI